MGHERSVQRKNLQDAHREEDEEADLRQKGDVRAGNLLNKTVEVRRQRGRDHDDDEAEELREEYHGYAPNAELTCHLRKLVRPLAYLLRANTTACTTLNFCTVQSDMYA